jgi:hypothetical protein
MKLQKFFKLLPDFIKDINVEGIIIKHTGEFITTPYSRRYEVEVPVYTIENPNDLPYTKESLTTWLAEEYLGFQRFVNILAGGPITYFVEFDNSVEDIYIPKQIKEEIDNCLASKDFNKVSWRNPENIRVIGEFKRYNTFNTEDDRIIWQVDFKPHRIEIVDEVGEFKREVSKSDYDYIFETLREDMEFFENKIWSCVQSRLSSRKTFVDFDWMSWYTHVDNVNY